MVPSVLVRGFSLPGTVDLDPRFGDTEPNTADGVCTGNFGVLFFGLGTGVSLPFADTQNRVLVLVRQSERFPHSELLTE